MPLGEMRLRGIAARGPEQHRRSATSTARHLAKVQ